jgi:hypothetical protein
VPLRLRHDVSATDTQDGAVLLDGKSGRYWQLNRTGAWVLSSLADERRPEQIAEDLASRYGIDGERALTDVRAIVDMLRSARLVDES